MDIKTVKAPPSNSIIAGLSRKAVRTLVKPIAIIAVSSNSRAAIFTRLVNVLITPKNRSG
jgi:hypothetical protein